MRAALLAALALLQMAEAANAPPVAGPDAMRYERAITVPAGTGQACAVLDATIYPHAEPALSDLRIFPDPAVGAAVAVGKPGGAVREVPYALTLSEAVTEETQPARLLNLGTVGGKIEFDLEMPARAYTDVTLNLDPAVQDFLATATVEGADELGSHVKVTQLGSFTLFDLSSQKLSRDTTLPLPESTYRYLHVELSLAHAPGAVSGTSFVPAMVQGATVPPSREAQILYSTVAETSAVRTVGRESRASFEVPARVPVERVEVVLTPGVKGNFSREVRVTAEAEKQMKPEDDQRAPLPETVTGTILRVHETEAGREIRTEELGFPAILGANLQRGAKVEVAIENGDDQPLPVAAVRLEMRQRKICFDASAAVDGLALFYGDPGLAAPVYDYAKLFRPAEKALAATLGPERLNPAYRPAPAEKLPFTQRHPEVLWVALIAVVCALGMVALRSAKSVGR